MDRAVKYEKDRQFIYSVKLRSVSTIIVAVEKQ